MDADGRGIGIWTRTALNHIRTHGSPPSGTGGQARQRRRSCARSRWRWPPARPRATWWRHLAHGGAHPSRRPLHLGRGRGQRGGRRAPRGAAGLPGRRHRRAPRQRGPGRADGRGAPGAGRAAGRPADRRASARVTRSAASRSRSGRPGTSPTWKRGSSGWPTPGETATPTPRWPAGSSARATARRPFRRGGSPPCPEVERLRSSPCAWWARRRSARPLRAIYLSPCPHTPHRKARSNDATFPAPAHPGRRPARRPDRRRYRRCRCLDRPGAESFRGHEEPRVPHRRHRASPHGIARHQECERLDRGAVQGLRAGGFAGNVAVRGRLGAGAHRLPARGTVPAQPDGAQLGLDRGHRREDADRPRDPDRPVYPREPGGLQGQGEGRVAPASPRRPTSGIRMARP